MYFILKSNLFVFVFAKGIVGCFIPAAGLLRVLSIKHSRKENIVVRALCIFVVSLTPVHLLPVGHLVVQKAGEQLLCFTAH